MSAHEKLCMCACEVNRTRTGSRHGTVQSAPQAAAGTAGSDVTGKMAAAPARRLISPNRERRQRQRRDESAAAGPPHRAACLARYGAQFQPLPRRAVCLSGPRLSGKPARPSRQPSSEGGLATPQCGVIPCSVQVLPTDTWRDTVS